MAWDSVSFRRRILAVIRRIPRGRVATYGQVATLAGYPRNARRVGQVLAHAGPDALPWQRVVNAQGRISRRAPRPERAIGARELEQERLLKREGVRFRSGRIDLARYRWVPGGSADVECEDGAPACAKRTAATRARGIARRTGKAVRGAS
jgi:methylated-DNA-protein-cysteine methyltransferase-like protein